MSRPSFAAALLALSTLAPAVAPLEAQAPAASQAPAGEPAPIEIDPGYLQVRDLLHQGRRTRREAAAALVERGDASLAFGIVDALFFIPVRLRDEALDALRRLTGEDPGDSYWHWVEVMGRLGETVRPAPGYAAWKGLLLAKIDREYRDILYPGTPARIRLEEVVTGGVPVEGIPALDDPAMVPAEEAGYLRDDEEIFGVVLGGEARAYPLRILDWHEMLNDVVGGVPVTLSYCTLCGSGVLYATRVDGGRVLRFGTSGLLYRSNKLMIERDSRSLWSNLTGEPVIGRQVGSGLRLELLPHTRTTWGEWRRRHPDTLAVDLDRELRQVAREHGFDYRPGEADEAREGVRFPVWKKSDALERDEEVYALRFGDRAKAYPLSRLLDAGVVNDVVAGRPVVLVADAESGAVRAYGRGDGELSPVPSDTPGAPLELTDAAGVRYRIEEQALVPSAGEAPRHGRLPGHFAFWFGWYAFFPQTEVWQGPTAPGAGE